MSNADRIVLDTRGTLHAHSHGLFGWCRKCDGHVEVPVPAIIAARGAMCSIPAIPEGRRAAGLSASQGCFPLSGTSGWLAKYSQAIRHLRGRNRLRRCFTRRVPLAQRPK
jgi:hypothetical protein